MVVWKALGVEGLYTVDARPAGPKILPGGYPVEPYRTDHADASYDDTAPHMLECLPAV